METETGAQSSPRVSALSSALAGQAEGQQEQRTNAPPRRSASGRPSLRRNSSGAPRQGLQPLAPIRATSVERLKPQPKPLAVGAVRPNRFVPLPGYSQHIPEENAEDMMSTEEETEYDLGASIGALDQVAMARRRNCGRITVLVVAESFNLRRVGLELRRLYPAAEYKAYGAETVYVRTAFSASLVPGDIFIHDYGVVVCWNLTAEQEGEIVDEILKGCSDKLIGSDEEMLAHTAHLSFHYSGHEPPNIKNDVITIHKSQAFDAEVKLAISHALAQSCKLSVYEDRIVQLVEEVRHLPEEMATYGEVRMSRRTAAMLMGKVFLQKSAVNLLNPVLDTPEFFWTAPDKLQALYGKVCEYKDLEERVELVNARFEIIQRMLNIWIQHHHTSHASRLNVIVVLLVAVEVLLQAFHVAAMVYRMNEGGL